MIVFCHLLNDNSGSPTVLRSTLEALEAKAHCDVLYVGAQGLGVLETANVQTRRYWYHRSSYRLITLFTYFASQVVLYRSLSHARDIPNDAIVFVNTLLPFGAMLWGKKTGRTVIVHVHEVSISPLPLRKFLTTCASMCADQLLYVSRDHLQRLPIKGPPADIVPNPVSKAIADRTTIYAPRKSGRFCVLMLSSLRGYKGVDEFMTLAQSLANRDDIAFTLVLNAEQVEVDSFASQYGELENVSVHSRTNDPAAFYEMADVLLNLARVDQWIETFGLTLIEAMTFGVPVIAPPIGGPTEFVISRLNGYCIDSRDTDSLRQAILNIADNPELAMQLSGEAKASARCFSFDKYSERIRTVLSPYLERRAPL